MLSVKQGSIKYHIIKISGNVDKPTLTTDSEILIFRSLLKKKKKNFAKTKTFFSHNTSLLFDDFIFSFCLFVCLFVRYSNLIKVFDERGYARNFCLHRSDIYIYLYLSFLLPFHFSFSEPPPPPPPISLFLTETNASLLVKSMMKLDTLDGVQPEPSAQMLTIKTNNPWHHHSNIYLLLSLSFIFCLFWPFLLYNSIFILSISSMADRGVLVV